jgi:CTP synthase
MTIVFVTHATDLPALDGMIAGEIAARRDAVFIPLFAGGAGLGRYDCAQHVLAHGELAPNGLLWAERATDRFVGAPIQYGAVARLDEPAIVVPVNPAVPAQAVMAERARDGALARGHAVETCEVTEEDGTFVARPSGSDDVIGRWRRDAFGRPQAEGAPAHRNGGIPLRILLVGEEDLLRDTYPANLAALGDAADALGLAVEPVFLDARASAGQPVEAILAAVDGVILPGGSDMEQVPGQIEIAQAAMRHDLPTLGLCLGMQTMATAAVRNLAGFNDANLAEADPDAQTKTFVRLRDAEGRPDFRVGLDRSRIVQGTHLSAIFAGAEETRIHCNHRFVLDPALHRPLAAGGLVISGLQAERDLADAIEMPALRFFIGMQGHPELLSRPGRPHPLFRAFLSAAAR